MSRQPATRHGYIPVHLHFRSGSPQGRLNCISELIKDQVLILDLDYDEPFFASSAHCFSLPAKAYRYVLNGWSIRRAFVKDDLLDEVNSCLGGYGLVVAKVLT